LLTLTELLPLKLQKCNFYIDLTKHVLYLTMGCTVVTVGRDQQFSPVPTGSKFISWSFNPNYTWGSPFYPANNSSVFIAQLWPLSSLVNYVTG